MLHHFGTAHEQGGGDGIGIGGGGEGDGGEQGVVDGAAGAWVDDVTVEMAVGLEAFSPDGGYGEGFVVEIDQGDGLVVGGRGVGGGGGGEGEGGGAADGDAPGVGDIGGGVAEGDDGAGAAVEEGVGDTVFAEGFGGAIEGVAFADGAEVEDEAGLEEADGEVGFVEVEVLEADAGAGGVEFAWGGDLAGAAHEAPGAKEGCGGDIEGAVGGVAEEDGVLEEAEDLGAEVDGVMGGVEVGVVDFGGGVVEVEGGFDAADFVEGFFAGGADLGFVLSVEDELEAGGHGVAGETDGDHGGKRKAAVWNGGRGGRNG